MIKTFFSIVLLSIYSIGSIQASPTAKDSCIEGIIDAYCDALNKQCAPSDYVCTIAASLSSSDACKKQCPGITDTQKQDCIKGCGVNRKC